MTYKSVIITLKVVRMICKTVFIGLKVAQCHVNSYICIKMIRMPCEAVILGLKGGCNDM